MTTRVLFVCGLFDTPSSRRSSSGGGAMLVCAGAAAGRTHRMCHPLFSSPPPQGCASPSSSARSSSRSPTWASSTARSFVRRVFAYARNDGAAVERRGTAAAFGSLADTQGRGVTGASAAARVANRRRRGAMVWLINQHDADRASCAAAAVASVAVERGRSHAVLDEMHHTGSYAGLMKTAGAYKWTLQVGGGMGRRTSLVGGDVAIAS